MRNKPKFQLIGLLISYTLNLYAHRQYQVSPPKPALKKATFSSGWWFQYPKGKQDNENPKLLSKGNSQQACAKTFLPDDPSFHLLIQLL